MSVSEFVDQWLGHSIPEEGANASTGVVGGKPLLYLKDWHFVKVQVGVTFISPSYRIFFSLFYLRPRINSA